MASDQYTIHVAAAVITNEQGEVLIALRPVGAHQGGLWEFPGGKVEADEDISAALNRELHEELDIVVTLAHPLIQIPYQYPDKSVLLDVWRVVSYSGQPHGREGQDIRWVRPNELLGFDFPAANLPIVTAARLPEKYLITGGPADQPELFIEKLRHALENGVRLVQLRAKQLSESRYCELASRAKVICYEYDATLLLNRSPELVTELDCDGVHLSSDQLMAISERPLDMDHWVAASCHNQVELDHACSIGVDFVVVSPVLETKSHPGVTPIGWAGLQALSAQSQVPVYALGGMHVEMIDLAHQHGAQGIAAISGLWE
jgi:8-oxo-dGTP diphosphatase